MLRWQASYVSQHLLGAAAAGLSWFVPGGGAILRPLGFYLIPLGVALFLLGVEGVARYRVTETTRYPQQTGEIADMYFQTLGENYLWVIVAAMIVWLVSLIM